MKAGVYYEYGQLRYVMRNDNMHPERILQQRRTTITVHPDTSAHFSYDWIDVPFESE